MPGVDIPSAVTIGYNGYIFSVFVEPPEIEVRPNYDSAGRAVVSRTYSVSLTAIVTPEGGSTTLEHFEDMLAALQEPAGHFELLGTGFDDLDVCPDGGGGVRDVVWGPKPRLLRCTQIGNDQAWKVTWQCDVCIPACPEESTSGRAMQWNYRVSWSIDPSGLTRRTVSGLVKIGQTRVSSTSKLVLDSADRLRDAVAHIQLIPGYRRIPGTFELSEDRNTLTFTVTDEQLPSVAAPPPGIIDCTASHRMSNSTAAGFARWTGTISANYEVARGFGKGIAWRNFRLLVGKRLTQEGRGRRDKVQYIPLSLSVGEPEIYGKQTAEFSLSYALVVKGMGVNAGGGLNVKALSDFLSQAGLWVEPPDSGWREWAQSLADGLHNYPRGISQLFFDPRRDDVIVDICDPEPRPVPEGRAIRTEPSGRGRKSLDEELRREVLPGGRPAPEDSWMKYRVRLRVVPEDDVARLKVLPQKEVKWRPRDVDVDKPGRGWEADYPPGDDNAVFQFRGEPNIKIALEGEAVRVGYEVDPPRLKTAGGVPLVPMNDHTCYFETETVTNLMIPVVKAAWRQIYALPRTPGKPMTTPDNPLLGNAATKPTLTGFTALPD